MPFTRPLSLAYIVNLYPPYIVGGNELLAQQVITALRARGHTVHVLTGRGRDLPDDGYTHQALDLDLDQKEAIFLGGLPLTLRRLVDWHLYNGRSAQGVRAALEAIKPDVTIAWNLYMASAAPLVAARRAARVSIRSDRSMPTRLTPARASGTAIRPVPHPSSRTGPRTPLEGTARRWT